jgi:ABC-type iron transport system FetAB ATPase subunit
VIGIIAPVGIMLIWLLARCLLRLIEPTTGSIRFAGRRSPRSTGGSFATRGAPCRWSTCGAQSTPQRATHNRGAAPAASKMTPAEPRERFNAIIAEVRLGTDLVGRYPHGLSLGSGNASTLRPIAAHPSLVVLDEPTSPLDVSLRSLIILLLEALQKRLGLACEQLIATADALRRALPRNLEGLRLEQLWAYKHVQGGSGTDLHADMGVRIATSGSRLIRLRSILKLAASRFGRFECPRIGMPTLNGAASDLRWSEGSDRSAASLQSVGPI